MSDPPQVSSSSSNDAPSNSPSSVPMNSSSDESIPQKSNQLPVESAPPQPPLPESAEQENPPIVDGIDETEVSTVHSSSSSENPAPSSPTSEPASVSVRPGDLAAFSELFARFHTRVEKASAGRKYRPLRDAWDAAGDEIARASDRIRLPMVSDLVIEALRLGCESGKTAIVDACLDCIHRLFEYGHVGSAGASSDIALDVNDGALDELVTIVCACLEVKEEDVYLRMVQTLLTAATRTKSGLHQSTLLAAVRTIYNIFLNARMTGTRTTARVSLTQILNLVFSRMEAESSEGSASISDFSSHVSIPIGESQDAPAFNVPDAIPSTDYAGDVNGEFVSVLQRDAYLLFRALCKLSAKENVDPNSPDAVGIRSKLLSLELIRILINNSGTAFRSGDRFIYALRQYLSRSLLINCTWNSAEVMDISFDIFETLLRKDTMRPLLKGEISTLFDTVVFRFLESPTAGNMRKHRALSFLSRLSTDRQTMADLFVNYDCDIDSSKIFERIVTVVSTAAQNKSTNGTEDSTSTSNAANALGDGQLIALSAVVKVLHSLREWSKSLEIRDVTSNSENDGDVIAEKDSFEAEVNESNASKLGIDTSGGENGGSKLNGSSSEPASTAHVRPMTSINSAVGTVSEGSDHDTTRFEEALKAKRETSEGITLFNSKPKRGIEYLIKHGRLVESPEDIAKFLHKAENLDAAMLGDYLGDASQLSISVMHAYTDIYDFSGMTFDGALRLHVSGFRLPGEAQKIDRIMEKFASRYCECNPGIFANADAAYVLAYSTIMLHTDAHNDTIKNKMSKEDFIKNNRGINDGADLDPVFLGKLYDRITTTEIRLSSSMKDSTTGADGKSLHATSATASTMDPVQRARQFEQESERLMAQTKGLFTKKRRPTQDYTYYSATNVHLARLMFESAWYPVLAAISLNLEEASPLESKVVSLCLEGFRHGIAISSTFSLTTAKDAFVSSLAKFTHLSSISEMRAKNVECVRMILAIAAMEGDNLGEQWVLIVRAISLLEQIRAVANGNGNKYLLQKSHMLSVGSTFQDGNDGLNKRTATSATSPSSPTRNLNSGVPIVSGDTFRRLNTGRMNMNSPTGSKSDNSNRIDSKAASLATAVPEAEIERIFTNSSKLSASGVSDFCGALCAVALEELSETPVPRIFCIQKIVEMAYYNMDSRTRIQWAKIWDNMGPFFVSAMCHPNREVAMYAVDALRQLASKFLEKDELSNFAFQKAFLKPFESCYSRTNSASIRELVLSCISQIVLARAANIKSGWKSVFGVLAMAADDKVEALMNFGWQIVDSITRKYVGVLEDLYVDAVMGISAYTKAASSTPVSLMAVELLSGRCASSLLNWVEVKENGNKSLFSGDDDGHIGMWFPILTGLAAAMQDERSLVREAASTGLFKVLKEHGGRFAPSMWTLVFRGVLSPIFDDVRHLLECHDKNEAAIVAEWATTTGVTALQSFVDVFVLHLDVIRSILDDLLGLIRSWILQENEVVAREGMSILARLIMNAGDGFTNEDWKYIIKAITDLFTETMPYEIVGSNGGDSKNSELKQKSGVPENEFKRWNNRNRNEPSETGSPHIEKESYEDEIGVTPNGHSDVEESLEESAHDSKIHFRVVRAKCVVQLLLIEVVQEVVVNFYGRLKTEDIVSMSECLELSYRFAHQFNADVELRYSLWRTGFMNQVPNLLKQETNGLTTYLRIMFWLYLDEERGNVGAWSEEKVMGLCETVLRRYIHACEEAPSKSEERREVAALSPVVNFIVNSVMQMSEQQFRKHLDELYGILLELVDSCDDREVRQTVTKLLRARVVPSVGPYIGRAEVPGPLREKTLRTKVVADSNVQAEEEICAAIAKVGGVRSVKPAENKDDTFNLMTCAPDEMIVAGAMTLPFVKVAFIDEASCDRLD